MNNKEFYKTDKPLTVRESFNNTILLLSMVKSEYYYIIGFSRSEGIIEIGFDFESKLHGKNTEIIILDFYRSFILVITHISADQSKDIYRTQRPYLQKPGDHILRGSLHGRIDNATPPKRMQDDHVKH